MGAADAWDAPSAPTWGRKKERRPEQGSRSPSDTGIPTPADGGWTHTHTITVHIASNKLCLKGHPRSTCLLQEIARRSKAEPKGLRFASVDECSSCRF